jgi:hypothetical protein
MLDIGRVAMFLNAFPLLAFKRTTFNVCPFSIAARKVAALIMSGAFFEQGII